jgi:hypothetical protein
MDIRTRVLAGVLTAAALASGAAAAAAAQASTHPTEPLTFDLQRTALQFFSGTGPITGFPTGPLAPGDRIVGQDRLLQGGVPAGHDDEVCTVGFSRDVLCQAIVSFNGPGDVQASWSLRWPATGSQGPASFDGIIDGGTGAFADAHGTFHSRTLPDGDQQITATIGGG